MVGISNDELQWILKFIEVKCIWDKGIRLILLMWEVLAWIWEINEHVINSILIPFSMLRMDGAKLHNLGVFSRGFSGLLANEALLL